MSTSSGSRSSATTRAPRVAREPSRAELRPSATTRGMPSMSRNAYHQNWTVERIEARIAQVERQDRSVPEGAPTSRPAWEAARTALRDALAAERAGDTGRARDLANRAAEALGTAQRAYAAIHAGRAAARSIEGLASNRTGRNRESPVFPTAAKGLDATERRFIEQSAKDLREFGALINARGGIEAERAGTRHAVAVPYGSSRDSGLVFTHSHPSQGVDMPFSKADVEIASSRGLAGIRAVTPGGVTYTMAVRSGEHWPSWSSAIAPVFEQNSSLFSAALRPLAFSGRFSTEQLGALGVHLAWRSTARELGLIYTRQRR